LLAEGSNTVRGINRPAAIGNQSPPGRNHKGIRQCNKVRERVNFGSDYGFRIGGRVVGEQQQCSCYAAKGGQLRSKNVSRISPA
jgi:hypothetical protein